jgi:hypothetical protein
MIFIAGIEVTQGIQYYKSAQHLTDPAEQLPDNAVPLVAGKPAWVRVYVESTGPDAVDDVTGTLSVKVCQRLGNVLSPQPPGSIRAEVQPQYLTQRSDIGATLNFVLPADLMFGVLALEATVTAPGLAAPVVSSLTLPVSLVQVLKVRGILIGYAGPDPANPGASLTVPAPGVAVLQSTAGWTLLTYPVASAAVFEVASTITSSEALTGTGTNGGCPPSWIDLDNAVQQAKVADGNRSDYLYYGVIASGFPLNSNVIGCESGGVSAGFDGDQVTMAHELGHACGRAHAPCGGVGTSADPNYPAYPPYDTASNPSASIGEYGLNITNGDVFSPDVWKDFMSYCGAKWVSLYGYGLFTNNAHLNPSVATCSPRVREYLAYDPWWWLHYIPDPPPELLDPEEIAALPVRTENVISVTGVFESAGSDLRVTHVARCAVFSSTPAGTPTGLVADLRDKDGALIATAPVFQTSGRGGCGCGGAAKAGQADGPGSFHAFVADRAPGAMLSIRQGDRILWQRAASGRPIRMERPVLQADGDRIRVTWAVRERPDAEPTFWLRYSADRGRTWKVVATALRGDRVEVDAAHMAPGRLLIEIVGHDGFHSHRSEPVAFDNDAFVPEPAIVFPHPKFRLVEGTTLCLWASAAVPSTGRPDGLKLRWTVDGVDAGDTAQVWSTVPAAGKHVVELIVTDPRTGRAKRVEGTFTSVPAS